MGRRYGALLLLCFVGQLAAVVVADVGLGQKNYYPPSTPTPVSPAPSSSSPITPSSPAYSPPYSPTPSAPAPSSSSPITPSSPAYSPPYSSPSYSPPYSPAPSSSSPVTPSSPSYSPPYSPAPSSSSPVSPSPYYSPPYSPTPSSPAPSSSSPVSPSPYYSPPYSPTPSSPAPSSSSPVTPSSPSPYYSPPYSPTPSSPAPSSSSPVTPSSPTYSPPYSSPSYSPPYSPTPSSPAPSSSSPITPSSPAYSPPYVSPAPSSSSPIVQGPALSPSTSPVVPSYSPPTTGSPGCPPLSGWFATPGSSTPSWWSEQLNAEEKKKQAKESSIPAVHVSASGEKVVAAQVNEFEGDNGYTPSGSYGDPTVGSPASSPTFTPASPGTCDYWSSHTSTFPDILSILTTILDLFGGSSGSIFGSTTTLLQGLTSTRPDAFGSLLRQGSAAILNSYKYPGLFQFTPEVVKQSFRGALVSQQAAAVQAVIFENANLGFGRN